MKNSSKKFTSENPKTLYVFGFFRRDFLKDRKSGFTLIEILIVISIMALFTAMIYSSFDKSKAKSRDQKRVSDISNIQLSLEQYFNSHGVYPLTIEKLTEKPTPSSAPYLSEIPKDPSTNQPYSLNYFPISKNPAANKSQCVSFQLWTKFELANAYLDQKKGFDSGDLTKYKNTYECTDGTVSHDSAIINASNSVNPLVYDVMP